MSQLSHADVASILDYDPDTGEFTWKNRVGNTRRWNGRKAGYVEAQGYICIKLFSRIYKIHRVAWLLTYGEWPEHEIDHINGLRSDNRIANLRDVTVQTNLRNATMSRKNTTGATGVYRYGNTWRASIFINGRLKHLGSFTSLEEARRHRKAADAQFGYHPNHGKARA